MYICLSYLMAITFSSSVLHVFSFQYFPFFIHLTPIFVLFFSILGQTYLVSVDNFHFFNNRRFIFTPQ